MKTFTGLKEAHIRRDHNSHVALEFSHDKRNSYFLACEAKGLRFQHLPTPVFLKQFKFYANIPLDTAAISFLRCSKTCYTPDSRVIDLLFEVLKMNTISKDNAVDFMSVSLASLVDHYNELATLAGKSVVKNFKSKGEALKRIEAMTVEIKEPTALQVVNAKSEEATKAKAAAFKEQGEDHPVVKNGKKVIAATAKADKVMLAKSKADKAMPAKPKAKAAGGVGAYAREMIRADKTNAEILEAVKTKFPDSNTTVACLSWYRGKMKKGFFAAN